MVLRIVYLATIGDLNVVRFGSILAKSIGPTDSGAVLISAILIFGH